MSMNLSDNILHAMENFGIPLILIALREMVCGKSGVLNLRQEGMLLMSSVIGFMAAFTAGNLYWAMLLAIFSGLFLSRFIKLLSILRANNQGSTGITVTLFDNAALNSNDSGTGFIIRPPYNSKTQSTYVARHILLTPSVIIKKLSFTKYVFNNYKTLLGFALNGRLFPHGNSDERVLISSSSYVLV